MHEFLFPLREAMKLAGVTDQQLATKLGIDRNHILQIKRGKWKRLTPTELRRLSVWAARYKVLLPMVRPNPLWETFNGQSVFMYPAPNPRGSGRQWEARAEAKLAEVFQDLSTETDTPPPVTLDSVRESMQSRNCVFLGSPKSNLATEFAMATLLGIRPQTPATPLNKSRLKFLWANPSSLGNSSSFSETPQDIEKTGVRVATPQGPRFIEAKYINPENFRNYSGTGEDIGVLIACRKPLKTRENVTTLILCGFTGFATLDVTEALIEDGVSVFPYDFSSGASGLTFNSLVEAGRSVTLFMKTNYKKQPGGDFREAIGENRQWMPPWDEELPPH